MIASLPKRGCLACFAFVACVALLVLIDLDALLACFACFVCIASLGWGKLFRVYSPVSWVFSFRTLFFVLPRFLT